MNQGWICPKCETVNAPFMPTCFKCSGEDSQAPKSLKDAKALTKSQKQIINTMIDMAANGEAVNGSSISRKLDKTQSYISNVLRKLVSLGYVHRQGNIFTALKDEQGKEIPR